MMRNPPSHTRAAIADMIASKLSVSRLELTRQYERSGTIPYFIVDELLPEALAQEIATAFPGKDELHAKSTLREKKAVSSQMNRHDALIEEALFAFHDPKVVTLIEKITSHKLEADPMLYAGGISRMEKGDFLNPHIDNSHNKDRTRWRALNLLYYITPGWKLAMGGNLELWPEGMHGAQATIGAHFNRLVVMATHHHSLHSVSPVLGDLPRNCISNYYFSEAPMRADQQFHITAFRGRPEQKLRDLYLRSDAFLRMNLRRIKSSGFFNTGHWYKKSAD